MSLHIDFHKLDPRHLGHEVQHIAQAGPQELQRFVHDEFDHVFREAAGQVARESFRATAGFARKLHVKLTALRKAKPDLAEAIDDFGIGVSLTVLTFSYDRFLGRAEGLCNLLEHQAEHFTFDRRSVRWVLQNTGPSRVKVAINGQLFTSALSAGVEGDAPFALGVELVDIALEAAGVPE